MAAKPRPPPPAWRAAVGSARREGVELGGSAPPCGETNRCGRSAPGRTTPPSGETNRCGEQAVLLRPSPPCGAANCSRDAGGPPLLRLAAPQGWEMKPRPTPNLARRALFRAPSPFPRFVPSFALLGGTPRPSAPTDRLGPAQHKLGMAHGVLLGGLEEEKAGVFPAELNPTHYTPVPPVRSHELWPQAAPQLWLLRTPSVRPSVQSAAH